MWGGISSRGKTPLVVFPGNLNSTHYVEILECNLLPSACRLYQNDSWSLLHDNAPAHVSSFTRDYLQAHNITTVPHPSLSPDLNPIEHIWSIIQWQAQHEGAATLLELEEKVVEEWRSLDISTVQKTIDDLKTTMNAIIHAEGNFVTSAEKRRYKHSLY